MIEITAKKQYGDKVVLDVGKLTFEEGKAYALIGANGSGKSTLLKIIGNQLKAEGERVVSKELTIGYMPQQSYAFAMSVKRNIMLPVKAMDKKKRRYKLNALTNDLGLRGLLHKNAVKLSGGETQRMALARTLMVRCGLLLLDEPTAALDVGQAKAVIELLNKEVKENGVTLIFATHSLKQAELLADEALFLCGGKLMERGNPSEILKNPKSEELREFIGFSV